MQHTQQARCVVGSAGLITGCRGRSGWNQMHSGLCSHVELGVHFEEIEWALGGLGMAVWLMLSAGWWLSHGQQCVTAA